MPDAPGSLSRLDISSASAGDTARIAEALAPLARAGDVITLSGDLGSGKTEFARAFIRARAGKSIEVPSPTFTLVQTYELADAEIWHFDLYRVEHQDEIYELGLEDALIQAISLIEWPDRLGGLMPRERLDIDIKLAGGDARELTFNASQNWAERLAKLAAQIGEAE